MSNASDPKGSASHGSRNDDSSLFSLDALKQKDEPKTKKTTEDSGLIDLRALAAMEKSAEKPSSGLEVASVVAPADIFGGVGLGTPLIAPPPAAAVAAPPPDLAPAAPKKANTGLIIGGVIGAVGIAAAVFMATRGGSAPAATPQATAVTATVAATPTATAAPEPEEPKVAAVTPGQREKPAPTATAVAAPPPEKPAAAPVAKVPGPLPKAAPKAPAAPAEPAPPPKPACDLACQMQRAVNKGK